MAPNVGAIVFVVILDQISFSDYWSRIADPTFLVGSQYYKTNCKFIQCQKQKIEEYLKALFLKLVCMSQKKINKPELKLGKHIIAEGETSDMKVLNDPEFILKTMVEAAEYGNFIVLKKEFYKFDPQGVTAFVLLAESHISIHTWPEHNYMGIDIFTCGPKDPRKSLEYIKDKFKFEKLTVIELDRGK